MRANFILKYRKLKLKFSECGPGEAEWARIAGILPPIAQTNTGKRWQTLAKTGKEVCVRNQSSKNNQHVLVCVWKYRKDILLPKDLRVEDKQRFHSWGC